MARMTQAEIDDFLTKLRPFGLKIGAAAKKGDEDAKEVMRCYGMLRKCAEHGAMVACEEALNRWKAKQ